MGSIREVRRRARVVAARNRDHLQPKLIDGNLDRALDRGFPTAFVHLLPVVALRNRPIRGPAGRNRLVLADDLDVRRPSVAVLVAEDHLRRPEVKRIAIAFVAVPITGRPLRAVQLPVAFRPAALHPRAAVAVTVDVRRQIFWDTVAVPVLVRAARRRSGVAVGVVVVAVGAAGRLRREAVAILVPRGVDAPGLRAVAAVVRELIAVVAHERWLGEAAASVRVGAARRAAPTGAAGVGCSAVGVALALGPDGGGGGGRGRAVFGGTARDTGHQDQCGPSHHARESKSHDRPPSLAIGSPT